jgi:hypothetical protein
MKKYNLPEILVIVVCVIVVWFIAQALYSSWSKTYSTNLEMTLDEVCDQHGGYSYWSETERADPEDSPLPVFKCVL